MLKFMVFGDLHYDNVSDGDRRLNELLVHIKTVQPDFVVSLGDLCKPVEQNRKILQYKQALCVYVEIDNDEMRIKGMDGEYLSVTPEDIELYDYRWNGVSVKPQTSSCVIKRK